MSSSTIPASSIQARQANNSVGSATGPKTPATPVPQVIVLYRVVVIFVLASLLWKSSFYPAIYHIYTTFHLKDQFFPSILTNTFLLAALLLVPVLLGMIAMLVRNQAFLITQAAVTAVCMFGLCIHQGSYNDVTFLTCFWVSLWCVWYAVKLQTPEKELVKQAKVFGVLIVSLIFFGGAVGKWTPGYWSGQVLYEIYFLDRDFWLFNLLRANFDADSLRTIATYYSRFVILAETGCAFLWLLTPKLAGAIGVCMLTGIALLSNVQLFSVMFCMIGLMLIALHEPRPARNVFESA